MNVVENPDLPYEQLEYGIVKVAKGHVLAYFSLLVASGALVWEQWKKAEKDGKRSD